MNTKSAPWSRQWSLWGALLIFPWSGRCHGPCCSVVLASNLPQTAQTTWRRSIFGRRRWQTPCHATCSLSCSSTTLSGAGTLLFAVPWRPGQSSRNLATPSTAEKSWSFPYVLRPSSHPLHYVLRPSSHPLHSRHAIDIHGHNDPDPDSRPPCVPSTVGRLGTTSTFSSSPTCTATTAG